MYNTGKKKKKVWLVIALRKRIVPVISELKWFFSLKESSDPIVSAENISSYYPTVWPKPITQVAF